MRSHWQCHSRHWCLHPFLSGHLFKSMGQATVGWFQICCGIMMNSPCTRVRENTGVSEQKHCWGTHTLAPGASSLTGELLHSSERKLPFGLSAAGSHSEVQRMTPCGLRLQDLLCSRLDFLIFLPYGFVNKTLSLGQNIL
ncbi:hypothetical protein HJG60_011851 [Phyllostomus discolor]|uniref:Uncharacterized protein n=1 Tax=Phyllostomus discolor TaxID=89673 RepID=A0A833ZL91_9CHIR|nr:hypothetical protein HJG60_011851 [Phyllostomus discolor]